MIKDSAIIAVRSVEQVKYIRIVCCLLLITFFLCGCTSYIYLEKTPEHCYKGTDIYTFDHICEGASVQSASKDEYRYSTIAVYRKWAEYTNYLDDVEDAECLESSLFGFYAEYETPYGRITVEVIDNTGRNIDLRGTGYLDIEDYGLLRVEISR